MWCIGIKEQQWALGLCEMYVLQLDRFGVFLTCGYFTQGSREYIAHGKPFAQDNIYRSFMPQGIQSLSFGVNSSFTGSFSPIWASLLNIQYLPTLNQANGGRFHA